MSKLVKTVMVVAAVIGSDGEEEDDTMKMGSVQQMKLPVGNTAPTTSSKVCVRCCQADKCGTDLAVSKSYHRRHKVCEVHAKAHVVVIAGIRQRFCQQCSRFHEVAEFDESKRSCRRRLAKHNERRRKSTATAGSQHQGYDMSSSGKSSDGVTTLNASDGPKGRILKAAAATRSS